MQFWFRTSSLSTESVREMAKNLSRINLLKKAIDSYRVLYESNLSLRNESLPYDADLIHIYETAKLKLLALEHV